MPIAPTRDPFGERGLPEISRNALTLEHVASGVLRHGALLVRGFLSNGQVEELRRFLDLGSSRLTHGLDGTDTQASMLDALIAGYEQTGLLALAESYIGERPVGIPERTVVKRNERTRGLPWHQDSSFYRGKCGALNFWTALTPCGEQCPGLSVIPRRFETVIDPEQLAVTPSKRMMTVAERLEKDEGAISPVLGPGDALIFDEMTVHRTSARHWDVPSRDVAITWFLAPSRFPIGFEPIAL